MHSAPSVSYPVGRSVVLAGLLAAAAALGMVAVFAGVAYLSWVGAATAGLAWCGWVASSLWAWGRQPHGQLSWRAGTWSWVSEAYREGVGLLRVERVYDLQGAILLRLHNADGARTWVWVERRGDPARWHDLRRALIAHA